MKGSLSSIIRLLLDVYLTLNMRVVSAASKRNDAATATGAALGVVTLLQTIPIMSAVLVIKGERDLEFIGKQGVFAIYVLLLVVNFLLLRTMGLARSFEPEFLAMPSARRILLDVLVVSWVLFVLVFFVCSLPPLPPATS
jgi:hypothetical protein